MLVDVISALIYLCILVACVYLVIWVLGQIGVALSEQVMRIIWIIVALCVLLYIVTHFLPRLGLRAEVSTKIMLARGG